MASPSASGQLSHFMAGIYPLCSFLHVPGKMSRPAWLSLGTAFLVEPPTPQFDERTRGMALLTAAHTVLPWAYLDEKASKELKLPEEFRKSRYVVGRVYLPDENGNALKGSWFPVKLSALHPTLDVGLLSLGSHEPPTVNVKTPSSSSTQQQQPTKRPTSLSLSEASLVEADRFRAAVSKRHLLKRFRLSSRNLSLPSSSPIEHTLVDGSCSMGGEGAVVTSDLEKHERDLKAVAAEIAKKSASVASIVGFRAKGLLGTMNTMDPRALDALEPSVKAKLMAEMNDIEGRQEAATLGLRAIEGGQQRYYFVMSGSNGGSSPSSSSSCPSSSVQPQLTLPKALAADDSLPIISPEGGGGSSSECRNTASLRCASIGLVSQGYGYHGMSGSPVIVGKWGAVTDNLSDGAANSVGSTATTMMPPPEWCCGVLHGASKDPNSLTGTIPSSSSSQSSSAAGSVSVSPVGGEKEGSVAEMVAASSSPTPFVSYIPSDVVLDWCIRDLSSVRDEEEVRRIKRAHDPLRELVVKEEHLVQAIKTLKKTATSAAEERAHDDEGVVGAESRSVSASSTSSSSYSIADPVTDDMMTPDDEDLAFIAKIRQEKMERDALRKAGEKNI